MYSRNDTIVEILFYAEGDKMEKYFYVGKNRSPTMTSRSDELK